MIGILIKFPFLYFYSLNNILPYSLIRPNRITNDKVKLLYSNSLNPSMVGLKYEKFNISVEDSILLKGWFIHSKSQDTLGTIILIHGIANCKQSLLYVAEDLSKNGYNCIIFDQRASGESGGINCTLGYFEKNDIKHIIDSALSKFPNIEPIGIYGYSLGAAISLQTMAIDNRIKCGVSVSSFATLREVSYDYWEHLTHFKNDYIPNEAMKISERIANFQVDDVKPEESAKLIKCPVLIIHGKNDKKIKYEYSERIYKNINSPLKRIWLVENAGHDNIINISGNQFLDSVSSYFKTLLSDKT